MKKKSTFIVTLGFCLFAINASGQQFSQISVRNPNMVQNTLYHSVEIARFEQLPGPQTGNTSGLILAGYRNLATTNNVNWNTVTTRLLFHFDNNMRSFIDFNPAISDGGIALGTFNGEAIRINASNNYVGIGTTTPVAKLNVVGQTVLSRDNVGECCSEGNYTLAIAEKTGNKENPGTGRKATIQFHNGNQDEGAMELSNETGNRCIKLYDHQGFGLGLYSTGKGFFQRGIVTEGEIKASGTITTEGEIKASGTITTGGGLIIGNAQQIYGYGRMHINGGELLYILNKSGVVIGKEWGGTGDLVVQGRILTSKIKVAVPGGPNWSDYVFEKDYKLPTLTEVEKYILTNKHLPGIPSAEEVVKEGIDVVQMDAKLLAKIEELTLYMLEINKDNIELKRIIEIQNKKIDMLETQIMTIKK